MIESETETGGETVVSEIVVGEEGQAQENDELESRARTAEERAGELAERISSLEAELVEASAQNERGETRRKLDELLRQSGTIDLEAARTLAEGLIDSEELDATQAVATLKREKAFLFEMPKRGPSAMSGAGRFASELEGVATAARSTGDRREHAALHAPSAQRVGGTPRRTTKSESKTGNTNSTRLDTKREE